jgi:hypothetical protein
MTRRDEYERWRELRASQDGVELVATRSSNALDVRLARGERLALRRQR